MEDLSMQESFTWQNTDVLNPVFAQRGCGVCWIAVALAAVEAKYKIENAFLPSLSVQEVLTTFRYLYPKLIKKEDEKGCYGGNAKKAFDFLKKHGVCEARFFEYQARPTMEYCIPWEEIGKSKRYYATEMERVRGESATLKAITKQPLYGRIHTSKDFKYFTGDGVYQQEAKGKVGTHALLVIGYGVEKGIPYYQVKNSWGRSWGQEGYGKIKRDLMYPTMWMFNKVEQKDPSCVVRELIKAANPCKQRTAHKGSPSTV